MLKGLVQKLTWTVIVLLLVIGGFVVNKVQTDAAVSKATTQAKEAKDAEKVATAAAATSQMQANAARATANCLNTVLADRNQPTVDETDALKAFASADSLFKLALGAALVAPKDKQAHLYAVFLVVLSSAEKEGTAFDVALNKVAAERAATPLGAC